MQFADLEDSSIWSSRICRLRSTILEYLARNHLVNEEQENLRAWNLSRDTLGILYLERYCRG